MPMIEDLIARPILRANPERCPGSYDLHLYCKYENSAHGFQEFPWVIGTYQTGSEARSDARRSGWVLHRDDTATCPKCAKALRARQQIDREE